MASMFEAMARHRPEWLAQGILMRAVETEPAVRALMIEKLGGNLSLEEAPCITEEEVTQGGWRADVCVAWKNRTARLELKLLAGFTLRQEEALKRREIDLVVLPSMDGRELPEGLPVLTWRELADAALDPCLKRLLAEVSASSTWRLEEISEEELEQDLNSFLGEKEERRWGLMYRFLSTVHQHLTEEAPTEYRASDGWARTRKGEEPYYGFCFWLGNDDMPRYWLGFWRSKKSKKPVFGLSVPSESGQPVRFEEPLSFNAAALARRILSVARS